MVLLVNVRLNSTTNSKDTSNQLNSCMHNNINHHTKSNSVKFIITCFYCLNAINKNIPTLVFNINDKLMSQKCIPDIETVWKSMMELPSTDNLLSDIYTMPTDPDSLL